MPFGKAGKGRNEEHFFLQRIADAGKQRVENADPMRFGKTGKGVVRKDLFLQSAIRSRAEQLCIQRETILFGKAGKGRNEEHFFLQRSAAIGTQERVEYLNPMFFGKTGKGVMRKDVFLQSDIVNKAEQRCILRKTIFFGKTGKCAVRKNFSLQSDIGFRSEQLGIQSSSMAIRETGKAPLIFAQEQTFQRSMVVFQCAEQRAETLESMLVIRNQAEAVCLVGQKFFTKLFGKRSGKFLLIFQHGSDQICAMEPFQSIKLLPEKAAQLLTGLN